MIIKRSCLIILSLLILDLHCFAQATAASDSQVGMHRKYINVYNWGEFMSNGSDGLLNVNLEFEKATGIHVNYSTFSSNEEMYAKLKSSNVVYDVIFPSDYMISKMISEKFLAKLNFENIPNFKNIFANFKNLEYDPQNLYSVPYLWGVVGIIYNKNLVQKPVKGFDALWDKDLAKNILMFMNSRDSFGIAQKKLGVSFNTKSKADILNAAEELRKQKKLVQAYVMDEIFDKMQSEEAAIAPYYSGDALVMMKNNPNLDFVIPLNGTNRFVDAACVPANSEKKGWAELYINFLCDPKIALNNALYSGYSTPNELAYTMLPERIKNNKVAYPEQDVLSKTECYVYNSKEINELIDSLWIDIMIADEDNNVWVMPAFIVVCMIALISTNVIRSRLKKVNSKI